MAAKNSNSSSLESISDREIITSRLIKAPREMVFDAWTDPAQLVKWWGPNGFTTTNHRLEARPGGVWSFMMHGPDGVDYPNWIVYEEVLRPERLVYSHGEKEGVPAKFKSIVTFEEQGDKTLLTMRAIFPSAEVRDRVVRDHNAVEGGRQTLAHLAELLENREAS